MALPVGRLLGAFYESALSQTGDLVLVSRMWALIKSGRIEHCGSLSDLHASEVRLPVAVV